jgi:hypothetical protein
LNDFFHLIFDISPGTPKFSQSVAANQAQQEYVQSLGKATTFSSSKANIFL